MQEQVTQKTMALSIKTAKISGTVLQAAMRQFLKMYRKQRDTPKHGKQTLKQLMRHGTNVSNIEITDANIKAFSQTAKKYSIDFALKKADDVQPPERAEEREEQEHSGDRRQRKRKNPLLCQAQPYAASQLVCDNRSQRLQYTRIDKGSVLLSTQIT